MTDIWEHDSAVSVICGLFPEFQFLKQVKSSHELLIHSDPDLQRLLVFGRNTNHVKDQSAFDKAFL